jgi:hypothetical protein
LASIAEFPNRPILFSVKFVVASHGALMSISKMYLPASKFVGVRGPQNI